MFARTECCMVRGTEQRKFTEMNHAMSETWQLIRRSLWRRVAQGHRGVKPLQSLYAPLRALAVPQLSRFHLSSVQASNEGRFLLVYCVHFNFRWFWSWQQHTDMFCANIICKWEWQDWEMKGLLLTCFPQAAAFQTEAASNMMWLLSKQSLSADVWGPCDLD